MGLRTNLCYLLNYGLFNDAFSSFTWIILCVLMSGKVMCEWWILGDLKGSDSSLIEIPFHSSVGGAEENDHDSQDWSDSRQRVEPNISWIRVCIGIPTRSVLPSYSSSGIYTIFQNHWVSGLCQSSGILNTRKLVLENTTFRKLDLFPSSGEGKGTPTLLSQYERSNLNHWTQQSMYLPPFAWGRKQIQFPKRCVF
jgi:hypothetical protein